MAKGRSKVDHLGCTCIFKMAELTCRTIPIPEEFVGQLLGKNGSTVQWIQRNSGCERVWIDTRIQEHETLGHKWCVLRTYGKPNDHYNALRMIMSVLARRDE
jgi:hypothetical protein